MTGDEDLSKQKLPFKKKKKKSKTFIIKFTV